jgi:hypothetical protein
MKIVKDKMQWPKEEKDKNGQQTLHIKRTIEQQKPHDNWGCTQVLRKDRQFPLL